MQLEIGNTLNAQNIKEEDDVYFECKVRANPEHNRITWKHNVSCYYLHFITIVNKINIYPQGIALVQNATAGIVMSSQNLVLQKIKRENGGNYTCLASNDRGETTSSVVPLRVQCKY